MAPKVLINAAHSGCREGKGRVLTGEEMLAELPAHESDPVRKDLPIVQEWARSATSASPHITIDGGRFHAGQGHVLLVVTVTDDAETVRRELVPRLHHPDRLRVRTARPSDVELRHVLQWVLDEQMTAIRGSYVSSAGIDERAGVVRVSLNRVDPDLAAQLAAHKSGLIRVDEVPTIPVRPEKPSSGDAG